jgi:signal transduction histidine kinase/ligand-binding sensor domain-containing protein
MIRLPSLVFLVILVACVDSRTAVSQALAPAAPLLTIRDGLSQSSVQAIAQDAEGYLWFGTEDGLNRYDGYSFTVFRHIRYDSTSLPDNLILSLLCDRGGRLWVGSKTGLSYFEPGTRTFHSFRLSGDAVSGCSVVCQDSSMALWFGTDDGVFVLRRRDAQAAERFELPAGSARISLKNPRCMVVDPGGNVWIAPREQPYVVRTNPSTGESRTYSLPCAGDAISMTEGKGGTIVFGTFGEGMFALDPITGAGKSFRDGDDHRTFDARVWTLLRGSNGSLWIGTNGSGLIESGPGFHRRFDVADNFILTLFEDRSHLLWVGTGKGVQRLETWPSRFAAILQRDSVRVHECDVWGIAERKEGGLWVGTTDGLMTSDGISSILPTALEKKKVIKALLEDRRGRLWIGEMFDGLKVLKPGAGSPVRILFEGQPEPVREGDEVCSLYEDMDGRVWVATLRHGLCVVDSVSGHLITVKPDGEAAGIEQGLLCITPGPDGSLWLGSQSGSIVKYSPRHNRVTRFNSSMPAETGGGRPRVFSIAFSSDGSMWAGTYSGLVRLDSSMNHWTWFTVHDGLPNDVVYAVRFGPDGRIWASTNRGLAEYDPASRVFRNFDYRDGLQGDEFNSGSVCLTSGGAVYFGGTTGMSGVLRREPHTNTHIPPMVITEFRIGDRVLHPEVNRAGGMITLSPSDNVFSVQFAALDFVSSEKNVYAYRLEGLDEDWTLCGDRRFVSYTNLDPGDYVFTVRGSNNDGVWNESGASVRIRVNPPFWKTWWFTLLWSGTLGLSVVVAVQRRFSQLRERERVQQEVSRRIIESQEEERKRIGVSLHDSLGQSLLLIKNLATIASGEATAGGGASGRINDISSIASQALAEVREISYSLRPYLLDQLGLTGAVRSMCTRAGKSSEIHFEVYLDNIDGLVRKDHEINFFRIIQESVNNIVKHSGATEGVVRIERSNDMIHVDVRDNGSGFQELNRGFGLSGMAERVRILQGTLSVKSDPGRGTTIFITIPIVHGT